jgi:hypothetical protein
MTRISEQTLAGWIGPASDAEQNRYEWTCKQIRNALNESSALSDWSFDVYPKGSYPNFTNVVRDSDVDIAVELTSLARYQFSHGAKDMTMEDFGISRYTGTYGLARFKDDVEAALEAHFPAGTVKRGNKAIHIRQSSQGLAADVVPCEEHYQVINTDGRRRKGILLRNDANPSQHLVNYPQQHNDEGIDKNDATSRRFKRVVRILKRLENKMVDEDLIEPVPSFLIESAVWNVPDAAFTGPDTWTGRVRNALAHIFNGTRTSECDSSSEWKEVNDIKYLFHSSQSWTWQQAHQFADAAWDRIGLD